MYEYLGQNNQPPGVKGFAGYLNFYNITGKYFTTSFFL